MRKTLIIATASALLLACSKKPPIIPPALSHPLMAYTNLADKEVKYGQVQHIDIDNDGSNDF